MQKKENKLWRLIKDLFILLTNKIPGVKGYRELRSGRKTDKKLDDISNKLDIPKKDKKEAILLRQIFIKKIFDKEKLLDSIKGDYFLLMIFAFPQLPKVGFKKEDQEIVKKYLDKKMEGSNKRKYTTFLTEKLKFKKLGYSSSTSFFIKVKDLPKNLKKLSSLKEDLEKNLPLQQKEEWGLILRILNKSKNKTIVRYIKILNEKGFDKLYNLSFYLDSINFKKENIFAQNESSFLISHFLKLEDLVLKKKDLESLKNSLKFFDISLFYTSAIPKEIKEVLDKNQGRILNDLGLEHFFQEINKQDLKNIFKNILNEKYKESYVNTFYRKQGEFRDLLVKKGILV